MREAQAINKSLHALADVISSIGWWPLASSTFINHIPSISLSQQRVTRALPQLQVDPLAAGLPRYELRESPDPLQ